MSLHLTFNDSPVVLLDGGDGPPKLSGVAVPFGVASESSASDGRRYRFSGGPDNELVGAVAVREHDDYTPIGRISAADVTDAGASVVVDLVDTTAGRDSLTEARADLRNGFSLAFDPVESESGDDGVVDVKRWTIRHLGHVRHPAFGELTQVVAASTEGGDMPETTEPKVEVALLERLDQLEARLSAPKPEAAGPTLTPREALRAQLASGPGNGGKLLALADVVSSGNVGVLPPQWSSVMRDAFDATRYLIPRLGSIPFPSVGYSLTVPKVLQHTTVAARGTEKTELPSRALTTGSDTFTAQWWAGAVDIALELVYQSDPSIQALVVESLISQYAAATDAAATTSLNTSATATGSALSFASYGAFVATIMDTAEAIRVATGTPGDLLQLKTASWKSLMSLVDSQGRRILSTIGPTNADGSANLTSSWVDVGGITVFHNPRTTTDVQFNAVSARFAEYPPVQIVQDVAALAGRDIGILGATMWVPMFTSGIKRHAATR